MTDKIDFQQILLKNIYWVYLPILLLIILSLLSKIRCSTEITFILLIPLSIIYTLLFNIVYIYKNYPKSSISSRIVNIIFFLLILWIIGMIIFTILVATGNMDCNFMS